MIKHTIPLLLAVSTMLTGCGLRDPYTQSPNSTIAFPTAAAPMRGSQQEQDRRAKSATSVIVSYATLWVNWTAATLPRERAGLLALATGQLAEELRQEVAQATTTRLQEASRAYSRGRYVGVIGQAHGRMIVVTYEEVAPTGGQAQGTYQIYLAGTEHTTTGWRLSKWQPASDS